jgi:hypothetical protein
MLFCWRVFFLLTLFVPASFAVDDDLFTDIRQESEKAYTEETRTVAVLEFESTEEEVFYAVLQEKIVESAAKKLRDVQNKITLMDDAITLPGEAGKKYREQQKELSAYQATLAERFVEGVLRSRSELSVNSRVNLSPFQASLSSQDALNSQARELYAKLPKENKAEFLNSWKASLTDGKARQLFAPYVGMALLYGHEEPLVKKAANALTPFRQSFAEKKRQAAERPLPEIEEADYIVNIMNRYERMLPLTARNSLERIHTLENQIRNREGGKEAYRLNLQKLEFEKEAFLKIMQREGFDVAKALAAEHRPVKQGSESGVSPGFDVLFLKWYRQKQKEEKLMLWPFEETGEILVPFNPEDAEGGVLLRTRTRHLLRASESGLFLQLGERRFALQLDGLALIFDGSLEPLVANESKVKRGDRLAIINDPFEVRIIATNGRDSFLDFLSFF